MKYISKIIDSNDNKSSFNCGQIQLDNYLKFQSSQDFKRKLSVCFVLNNEENNQIVGYYTLSNYSIPLDFIPIELKNKLPNSYNQIPVTLLGRFAIDKSHQNKGIGKLLLIDALKRCYFTAMTIASFAIIVDPIDENATEFYKKFGFILLPDAGKMFLPMKIVSELFK